jgi:hypothetical protein
MPDRYRPLQTSTLRPGLLVSLKTSVTGNIDYRKRIIEADHVDNQGRQKAKWETVRTITDPVEMKAAWTVQLRARGLICAVCTNSAFGLLCPEAEGVVLAEAIADARKLAEEFNSAASLTRVRIYVITGRIAQDDVEAVRAINSEIRELLEDMQTGIANLDVEVIRKAANRAKAVGAMLSTDAASRVQTAVEAARSIARKIVKVGETASAEVDQTLLRQITTARTAFLDFEPSEEVSLPGQAGRAVDLEDSRAL